MLESIHITLQKEEVRVIKRVQVIFQHLLGHRFVKPTGVVMALLQKLRHDHADLTGGCRRSEFGVDTDQSDENSAAEAGQLANKCFHANGEHHVTFLQNYNFAKLPCHQYGRARKLSPCQRLTLFQSSPLPV